MSLQSHEFDALKTLFETLRTELVSLREAIQKSAASIRNEYITQKESDKQEWEKTQKVVASLRPTPEEQAADETNQERRHGQNRGLQILLTLGTWLAFIAAALYAWEAHKQSKTLSHTYAEMQKQTEAAEHSAYMACLNAIQIQKSAVDSHASALATVKQAATNVEDEKSIMSIIPRFPAREDLINHQLVIPYLIKNDGKSSMLTGEIWMKAVLLNDNDALRINSRNLGYGSGKYMSAGEVYPVNVDPRFKTPNLNVVVRDKAERIISDNSQQTTDFLNGDRGIVFIYGRMIYTDFFGTHRVKFCIPQYVINSGTTHNQTKAEHVCAAYNHQEDQYTQMPKLEALAPIDAASRGEPIKCDAPTE